MGEFQDSPDNPGAGLAARPFSGHERNRMMIQTEDNFDDVSLVSGADFREDGRGFGLLDFDRDGWIDLAVSSPNSPRFRLMRNTIGDRQESGSNQSVYITVQGGNKEAKSSQEWSARDGYGATLLVTIGDTKRMYQLSCGEGLSAQNSRWIHVGMGQDEVIDQIDVVWPSGKETTYKNIKSGSRVTLSEDGTKREH